MKTAGIDPGETNLAYGLLNDEHVESHGMMAPLGSINQGDDRFSVEKFLDGTADVIRRWGLTPGRDRVRIERYLPRPGRDAGANGEPMNLTIGLILTLVRQYDWELVMPSTWKLYMRRAHSIGRDPDSKEKAERAIKAAIRLAGGKQAKTVVPTDHKSMLHYFKATHPLLFKKAGKKPNRVAPVEMCTHEADALGMAIFDYEKRTGKTILPSVLVRRGIS